MDKLHWVRVKVNNARLMNSLLRHCCSDSRGGQFPAPGFWCDQAGVRLSAALLLCPPSSGVPVWKLPLYWLGRPWRLAALRRELSAACHLLWMGSVRAVQGQGATHRDRAQAALAEALSILGD